MQNEPKTLQYSFAFDDYDPDRLSEAIAGGNFEHTILDPASCSGAVKHWSTELFQVDRGDYSFPTLVKGHFPKGQLCIGMVSRMSIPTWINGHEVSTQNLQIYAEDVDLMYRAGFHATWKALCLSREELQSAAEIHMGRPLKIPQSAVANLSPEPSSLARLKRLMEASFQAVESNPKTAPIWRGRLAVACVEAIASSNSEMTGEIQQRARHRENIVRRADHFLRATIGDRYSSERLCRFLGMSERNIQFHFKQALGMSPKKWFQHLALQRAHHELRQRHHLDNAITEVAMNCGFEHFGRFAESYRLVFGERPSDTLRRHDSNQG